MTYQETEILIQKYLNGETTAEEEELLALEVSRKDAPSDWKIIAEMLGELAIDEALFDKIMAERKPKPSLVRFWPWVAAACVAVLLGIFVGPPREDTNSNPQIAKVEPKPEVVEEPKAVDPQETVENEVSTKTLSPLKTSHKSRASIRATKEQHKSDIGLFLCQFTPHPYTIEGIDEIDRVFSNGHERELRIGHQPHGNIRHVDDKPHVPLLHECLYGYVKRYDAENRGKGIKPELCFLIVVHLQCLELHIRQDAMKRVNHPRTKHF